MDSLKKIAESYGIPSFEDCVKINWNEPNYIGALYYVDYTHLGNTQKCIALKTAGNSYIIITKDYCTSYNPDYCVEDYNCTNFVKAPRLHEIHLPKYVAIGKDDGGFVIHLLNKNELCQPDITFETEIDARVYAYLNYN